MLNLSTIWPALVWVPVFTLTLVAVIGLAVHISVYVAERQRLRRIAGRIRRAIRWTPKIIQGGKLETKATEADTDGADQTTGTEG